jgi:hypothetical protein
MTTRKPPGTDRQNLAVASEDREMSAAPGSKRSIRDVHGDFALLPGAFPAHRRIVQRSVAIGRRSCSTRILALLPNALS